MKKEILLAVSCAFFGSCGYFSRSADDKGMVEDTVASRAVPSRGNAPGAELIRLFKSGIRTEAVDGSRRAVYIVFSPDSSKAELFGPAQGKPEMLDRRTLPSGGHVWNVEDDDTYMLEKCYDEWLVSRRRKVLYASTECENIQQAEFVGDKGEKLSATFFTQAGVAQIQYDGVDYMLRQYVTASGYGYKNSFVDIRGKRQELTLTFLGDGKSIAFVKKE